MAQRQVLAVGASGDAGAVFAALSTEYTVHAEPATVMRWTWLDTADWRLHRAGTALREERQGRRRDLVLDSPDAAVLSAPVNGVSWPARLDRVDDSPVRDAVSALVGVRALLPVAEVETRRILLRLMDDAGKTRARVSVDQQRLLGPRKAALPLHVAVRALRGYDRDARRCVEMLAEAMGAETTALSPTDAALSAAGRLPGAPGVDLVAVSADDPAVRPVAAALLADAAVVDDARDGALADLDTEFLHDLRSAIRSTRALLSAAGHLLLGRSAVRVERDLGWLDEMTAPLRAVDIALLQLADRPAGQQGSGGPDVSDLTELDPLRDQLLRRRRTELRRMRSTLRAQRAPAAFTAWRRDLSAMVDADVIGPSAREAAGTLAAEAYGRLGPAGDDELAARVGALRAVLAAFGPLYRPEPLGHLRQGLDELAELLRLRDGARILAVQVREASHAGDLPVDTVLAAGAVLDRTVRHIQALDDRIAATRADLLARRSARWVEGLTT